MTWAIASRDGVRVKLRPRAGDEIIRADNTLGDAHDLSFVGHRPDDLATHVRVAGIRRAAAAAGLR